MLTRCEIRSCPSLFHPHYPGYKGVKNGGARIEMDRRRSGGPLDAWSDAAVQWNGTV